MGALTNASLVIVTIGVIIFVHELGHFLLARWNGVEVLEFAIGFGPKLCSFKRGITRYSIRLIPFGGYVRMSGDDRQLFELTASTADTPDQENHELDEETRAALTRPEGWFLAKGYLAKCSVVFAGPLFNIIFAFFLAAASFALFGEAVLNEGPVIGDVQIGHPAHKAGIRPGDRVYSIDGVPMESWKQIAQTVRGSGGKELDLVVERSADKGTEEPSTSLTIRVEPVPDSAELEVITGTAAKGHVIGIAPAFTYEPMKRGEIVSLAALKVWRLSEMTVRSFWGLISGRLSRKHVGGPILMFQEASRSAKRGGGSLLDFMIFINVTLAILNLLPIPVLDGGHLLIFSVEALKGSALSLKTYQRVTATGMLVILSLMVLALTNDVGRVIGI